MSDRCTVKLHCRECDFPTVRETLGLTPGEMNECSESRFDLGEGTRAVLLHEMNYGACTELLELQERGVPFIAENTAGDDYEEGVTFFFPGTSDLANIATFNGTVDHPIITATKKPLQDWQHALVKLLRSKLIPE